MDKNYVLNLINGNLTKENAEELDDYFYKNVGELAEGYNANDTNLIITKISDVLGYSLIALEYSSYVREFNLDTLCTAYNEEELIKAKRYFEVINNCEYFSYYNRISHLGLKLGNHYYYKNDYDLAFFYYKTEFENEKFDYNEYEFFYKFENYLQLALKNYDKEIAYSKIYDFIKIGVKNKADSLDFVQVVTHYLSQYFNDKLYKYAYKAVSKLVKEYRKRRGKHTSFSDVDEERALCELVTVKFKYYVENDVFDKALETYHELTNEIRLSDCTRYYHPRDKFYHDLIEKLKKIYPSLNFFNFEDYLNAFKFKKLKFKQTPNLDNLLNQTITLINDKEQEYDFYVFYYIKNDCIYFQPILPIGKGAKIAGKIEIEKDNYYIVPLF